MVKNTAVESENKIITIKEAVQPARGSRYSRKFMGMIEGNPSTKMTGLGRRFQYEENKYMVTGALEEYSLIYAGASYEYPGE